MSRDKILAILALPGAFIEAALWSSDEFLMRGHWICDHPQARPWLRVPGRCVARLRSFTVERLVDEGAIVQAWPGQQSGYRTFILHKSSPEAA